MKLTGNQLNNLAAKIHKGNIEKDFWEEGQTEVDEIRIKLLVVSELFEMFEADRNGRIAQEVELSTIFLKDNCKEYNPNNHFLAFVNHFETRIKDSKEDELADTMIRLLDYSAFLKVDFNDERFELKVMKSYLKDYSGVFLHDLSDLIEGIGAALDNPVAFNIGCCYQALISFAKKYEIDLLTHVNLKLAYNATRTKKHGKKY
jgi:NTP pyrophosphatase (non-canonical NTP hydrolase)